MGGVCVCGGRGELTYATPPAISTGNPYSMKNKTELKKNSLHLKLSQETAKTGGSILKPLC